MSRTDKTDPFHVKQGRIRADDPFGFNRDTYRMMWRPEFGCGASCKSCGMHAWNRAEKRRERRSWRNWEKDYE